MIETRKEYIIIYIVFINTHFNVWGKYGVPLSINHVFVTHHRPFTVTSNILLIIVAYLFNVLI